MKFKKGEFLNFMKYFGVTLIVIVSVAFFVLLYAEYRTITTSQVWMGVEEENIIKAEISLLDNEVGLIISDLSYLKSQVDSQIDVTNHVPNDLSFLHKNWLLFAENKTIYDQIRFIDEKGKEQIRVNRQEDRVELIDKEGLQYKGDRYYYKKTTMLKEGEIYISSFDLNVEGGKVELPRKPMIRFSTPIYADDGSFKGVVILNYLGSHVLSRFEEVLKYSNGNLYLVNDDGYYLYSGLPYKDFAFMFEDQAMNSFIVDYPKAWEEIKMKKTQFLSENGFFFIRVLNLEADIQSIGQNQTIVCDSKWYVISHIPNSSKQYYYLEPRFDSMMFSILNENYIFFIFLILLAMLIGILFYQNKVSFNRIRYLSEYDGMTSILNRRAGLNSLRELLRTYDARAGKMFLCYLDVDGLKQVNDRLGHNVGDELILTIVKVVKLMIRESDLFIRLGGDEFLLVLHHMDKDVHRVIWKRIENEISRINHEETRPYQVSVSKGFLEVTADNVDDMELLMKKVDQLMYQDKLEKKELKIIRDKE